MKNEQVSGGQTASLEDVAREYGGIVSSSCRSRKRINSPGKDHGKVLL
jgi:hypothetical protein